MTAALSTAAVFACFSASALLTRRRAYLFLGGYLSSAVAALFALRLASWAFGRQALGFEAELYGGLLVFSGYVLFDTQVRRPRLLAGWEGGGGEEGTARAPFAVRFPPAASAGAWAGRWLAPRGKLCGGPCGALAGRLVGRWRVR